MRIPCPYCGPRDVGEFTYGGDATVVRPDPNNAGPDAWCDYVYNRTNPIGAHREYWHHVQGCRLWLKVTRDTLTHAIREAEIVGPWAKGGRAKGRDAA